MKEERSIRMKLLNDKIDLTEEAKSIFGDIVEYAYIQKPEWAKFFGLDFVDADNSKIEPKDAYPVFVKFTNGKSFQIWSSEWGGIKSVTEKEYLEDL
jgi:hypothetical protein